MQQAYAAVAVELGFDDTMSVNERAKAIILAADELQDQICQEADTIKIEAYDKVKEAWPELGIPKPVWLELVHVRRLQRHTSLSDNFIAKIMQSFEGAKNITALRSTIIDAIKNNSLEALQVPTVTDEKQLQFEPTEELPEAFIELLNECADTRHHLDSVLWPKMRVYGDAFCCLTKEPYKVFKNLLDMWHYRNGGWPKETTPPRIWSVIFRFIQNYDMLQQYGFDIAERWCKRMGLQTIRTMPSPTMYMFNDVQAERFGQYFMFKLKDDVASKYPQYKFEPWLHCIANDGKFFAYVWDTREIKFSGELGDIDINDVHTDYSDSCKPLKFGESASTELMQLAMQCIPDALAEPESPKPNKFVIPEILHPVDHKAAVEQRKAEIRATILKNLNNNPEAAAMMSNDIEDKVKWQQEHPEYNFPGEDKVKKLQWHPGDKCWNEVIGAGEVLDANFETGRLVVLSYHFNWTAEFWPWHLTKREPIQ